MRPRCQVYSHRHSFAQTVTNVRRPNKREFLTYPQLSCPDRLSRSHSTVAEWHTVSSWNMPFHPPWSKHGSPRYHDEMAGSFWIRQSRDGLTQALLVGSYSGSDQHENEQITTATMARFWCVYGTHIVRIVFQFSRIFSVILPRKRCCRSYGEIFSREGNTHFLQTLSNGPSRRKSSLRVPGCFSGT